VVLLILLYLSNLLYIYRTMDVDKWKNDFLTSHNISAENADIQSKFYPWYAIFITELLPPTYVIGIYVCLLCLFLRI